MKTMISETIDLIEGKKQYDAACKIVLSQKMIIASILKGCCDEFEELAVEEIAVRCIEGEPYVSTEAGNAEDVMPLIHGINTEDVSLTEGRITGDIRFVAAAPGRHRQYFDIEAQNTFRPNYPLTKRGAYYLGRMLSGQRGTEFTNSDYHKLKKVNVIWICLDPPKDWENAITHYETLERHQMGYGSLGIDEYDLMSQVVIGLGDPEDKSAVGVLRLLGVLFSNDYDAEETKRILEMEFGLPMRDSLKEDVENMCNFSETIVKRGLEKGMAQGIAQGMAQGLAQGIEQGMESAFRNINELNQRLLSEGKIEELRRSTVEPEYQRQLMEEYGFVFPA